MNTQTDISVELSDAVATVEIRRPPHNFFDMALIKQLADAFEALDKDPACRSIVLAAEGKSFCAGANLSKPGDPAQSGHLYLEAVRLFRCKKPVVGAIQGPAIGGGLGLALVPDFRVACPETRFAANFTILGFHPGFGLTVTLPELIGKSKAALMFYTSRRIKGDEAVAMGLADLLVPQDQVRSAALALAREIATCAPLAVIATRATARQGLADRVKAATEHELEEQTRLRQTQDFKEGVKASAERRSPKFTGS